MYSNATCRLDMKTNSNLIIPELVLYPDLRLRKKSIEVTIVDEDARNDFDILKGGVERHSSLGIAGAQLGIMRKMFVIDHDYLLEKTESRGEEACSTSSLTAGSGYLYMANCRIIKKSSEMFSCPDGCLSIPTVYATTVRPFEITAEYLDYNNERQTITATGLLSGCIQHETDHTNGILFVDHLSPLKRKLMLTQYAKRSNEQQ